MTIKGTEYNNGDRMTLLTDPAYRSQQDAIGSYNRWLENHQALFQNRTNLAPVGLLHPEEDLWRHWMSLAPVYYGVSQVLTAAGIPWRVVRKGDNPQAFQVLLTFTPDDREFQFPDMDCPSMHVPALAGWSWRKVSAAAKGGIWHDLLESLGLSLVRAYHGSRFTRRLMDSLNMVKLVNQKVLFGLPSANLTDSLLAELPAGLVPRVKAADPVLIEYWGQGGQKQVHLLNYGQGVQEVSVEFDQPVRAQLISPDTAQDLVLEGQTLTFSLDIYSVLLLD
jgi:hypothetical protein